jgi:hypothetical protein
MTVAAVKAKALRMGFIKIIPLAGVRAPVLRLQHALVDTPGTRGKFPGAGKSFRLRA